MKKVQTCLDFFHFWSLEFPGIAEPEGVEDGTPDAFAPLADGYFPAEPNFSRQAIIPPNTLNAL